MTHEGIALSKDFVIHSSGQGVYVLPLYEGGCAISSPGPAASSKRNKPLNQLG